MAEPSVSPWEKVHHIRRKLALYNKLCPLPSLSLSLWSWGGGPRKKSSKEEAGQSHTSRWIQRQKTVWTKCGQVQDPARVGQEDGQEDGGPGWGNPQVSRRPLLVLGEKKGPERSQEAALFGVRRHPSSLQPAIHVTKIPFLFWTRSRIASPSPWQFSTAVWPASANRMWVDMMKWCFWQRHLKGTISSAFAWSHPPLTLQTWAQNYVRTPGSSSQKHYCNFKLDILRFCHCSITWTLANIAFSP